MHYSFKNTYQYLLLTYKSSDIIMSTENTNETKYLDLHGTEILVDKVKELIEDVRKEITSPIGYQYIERNTYWGGNFTTGTPHDILPNTYNEWTSKAPKSIRLVKPEENKTAEYILKFTVSDTGHSIVFENEIKWRNNDIPTWETGKTYEINIMNGLASYMEF